MDVHGESSVTWEDVSNYFIEQGMSGPWQGMAVKDSMDYAVEVFF